MHAVHSITLLVALLTAPAPMAAGGFAQPTWLRSGGTDTGPGTRGDALLLMHACENDYAVGLVSTILSARAKGWVYDIVVLAAGISNTTIAAVQAAGATDLLLYPQEFYTLGGWQAPSFAEPGFR